MITLKHTWLVQRLHPPYKKPTPNPFSFGGGGSGLTQVAQNVLAEYCDFDYMGAAEYEDGIVQKSFAQLAAWGVEETLCSFGTSHHGIGISGICYASVRHDVANRIHNLADDKCPLKEPSHLTYHIKKPKWMKEVPKTVGWLELNNPFMFFVDHDMWHNFKRLLKARDSMQFARKHVGSFRTPRVPRAASSII